VGLVKDFVLGFLFQQNLFVVYCQLMDDSRKSAGIWVRNLEEVFAYK
jgi:hypothetical protein